MIVAIANQKGGVGKTTTAINLAAGLAMRGKPTLLIDLDPQANSTMSFLDMPQVTRSVYDAIADPSVALKDVILPSTVENLWIAPSRIALAKLEATLVGEMDAHFRLKDKLEPLRREFPQVVIDCPPTLGLLTVNALVAATHLLIPIQSSYFALEGTDDLLETIEKVRARPNPALRILGVVITMHDKRTALARDIRTQIRKVFAGKVFKTVITKSVRLEESRRTRNPSSRSRPIPAARPNTTGFARRSSTVPRRGLPDTIAMRHDEHYVEALAASAGTPVGRMVAIELVDPNPNQP